MATVLYAVPGTEHSDEALLDALIPQTAKIDRRKATLKIEYDGEPKFEPVSGSAMHYAVNTATPVIRADAKYYAVDNGIWFIADKATGPWQVAVSVPAQIYDIEPDSPLYHSTFLRIYKVTLEYVYVGYTPGYTNTYVYNSTIVYGTGYSYPGRYGSYYYPRPGASDSATVTDPSASALVTAAGTGVAGGCLHAAAVIEIATATATGRGIMPATARATAEAHGKTFTTTTLRHESPETEDKQMWLEHPPTDPTTSTPTAGATCTDKPVRATGSPRQIPDGKGPTPAAAGPGR